MKAGAWGATTAILLAAGASSRLGQPKQLVTLRGEALIRRAARAGLESGVNRVVVALGAEQAACAVALEGLAVELLPVADWREGMGATLGAAMRHVLATDSPEAVLVLLCDQFRVTPAQLLRLRDEGGAGGKGIAAARDAEWLGPPAIFAAKWFPALAAMQGERGARSLIGRHPEDVTVVELPGIAADLDEPSDLARLAAENAGS